MYVGWKECEGNLKKGDREKKKGKLQITALWFWGLSLWLSYFSKPTLKRGKGIL